MIGGQGIVDLQNHSFELARRCHVHRDGHRTGAVDAERESGVGCYRRIGKRPRGGNGGLSAVAKDLVIVVISIDLIDAPIASHFVEVSAAAYDIVAATTRDEIVPRATIHVIVP